MTTILESGGTRIMANLLKKFHILTKLLTVSSTETVFQIVDNKGGSPGGEALRNLEFKWDRSGG